MKTQTLKTRNTLISRKQIDKDHEYFVLWFAGSSRSFLGAAGVLNFLEPHVDEYELSQIDFWLNELEIAMAA